MGKEAKEPKSYCWKTAKDIMFLASPSRNLSKFFGETILVIYWISKNIGTTSMDELKRIPPTPEFIPEDYAVISLLDINDGFDSPTKIYLRLKSSLVYLAHGKKVIFVCLAGISRSNAFATTLIAFLENKDWDDVYYNIIKKKVPRANVNQDLAYSCKLALKMMYERLVKECPYCNAKIESWESACEWCWYKIHI